MTNREPITKLAKPNIPLLSESKGGKNMQYWSIPSLTARGQSMTRPQAVGLLHFHVPDTDLALILTRQTVIAFPPMWAFPKSGSGPNRARAVA